mgnify:CR=1 FL=1
MQSKSKIAVTMALMGALVFVSMVLDRYLSPYMRRLRVHERLHAHRHRIVRPDPRQSVDHAVLRGGVRPVQLPGGAAADYVYTGFVAGIVIMLNGRLEMLKFRKISYNDLLHAFRL